MIHSAQKSLIELLLTESESHNLGACTGIVFGVPAAIMQSAYYSYYDIKPSSLLWKSYTWTELIGYTTIMIGSLYLWYRMKFYYHPRKFIFGALVGFCCAYSFVSLFYSGWGMINHK